MEYLKSLWGEKSLGNVLSLHGAVNVLELTECFFSGLKIFLKQLFYLFDSTGLSQIIFFSFLSAVFKCCLFESNIKL